MFHVLSDNKACEHKILVITTSDVGGRIVPIAREGSINVDVGGVSRLKNSATSLVIEKHVKD